MNLLTLDVETTLNAPKDMGEAHPMHPDNKIVLLGTTSYPFDGGKRTELYDTLPLTGLYEDITTTRPDFIVGSNISFDLLYIYRAERDLSKEGLTSEGSTSLKRKIQDQRLWDIQLAEYLLTGQQSKFASLDEMAVKYGLPVKDDAVTKYFQAGIGSEKIPLELLKPYLVRDLENTEAIANIQMTKALEMKMFDLIISQMEALHAVTEMMFNGLAIDLPYFQDYTARVATDYADLRVTLQENASKLGVSYYPVDDVDSALQWSKLFFGGTLKVPTKTAVGVFKNGKTKYKVGTMAVDKTPLCEIKPPDEWKSEKTGKISVDEKILTTLLTLSKIPAVTSLTKQLLEYREISKQLTTYIQGLGKHIISTGSSTYIHGRLNQVNTATGRLSSTSPNLQNISNNPIKSAFVSRYGLGGKLVEFDFAQLEVAVLAHITNDTTLIKDISSGKDIHSELYYDMYHRLPEEAERKWFKRLTFGLIYGAGAKTLAENAGCDYNVAKKFMETFYKRYPEVPAWHKSMNDLANVRGEHDSADGIVEMGRKYRWSSSTGRIYVFREYKSTYNPDREYTFSPTELKNYPVQGLATGDIVPMMLGILFRKFKDREGVHLVNTVHDSIMFDVTDEAIFDGVLKEIADVLNNTHEYYKKTFGHPLALKLNASASVGINWFTTEKV